LPYQTIEVWQDDIKEFIQLGLDGLSTYPLLVLEGTKLAKAINEGVIPTPPGIIAKADMFEKCVEIMGSTRYNRMFFNHWAKTSRERSIYPKTSVKDCVPFGSGARGQLKGYLIHQDSALKDYYVKINNGWKPVGWLGKPSGHYKLFLDIVGQMEMTHCNIRAIGHRYGLDLEEILAPLLNQWERVGLIEMDEGWIELRLPGEFWLGNLCQGMIDYFLYNYKTEKPYPKSTNSRY
jgi:oxygen-independent coproporphyrinogen-3 oxidase